MKNVFLLICFFSFVFNSSLSAQSFQTIGNNITCTSGDTSQLCENMQLIYLNDSFSLPVNGPSAPIGNNYGCLATQPNPVWFFMNVGTSGSIYMELASTTLVDLDYIL